MDITLKQLKVFLAVARSKNLTAAAAQLFMTKGAVSQTITELEKRLGQSLFERHNSRIFINSEGEKLIPVADELLSRANDINHIFSNNHIDVAVFLGCSKTVGSYILPGLLAGFKKEHNWFPKVNIENTRDLINKILNFELDLAIVEGVITDDNITSTKWIKDEMVVVAAIDNQLATGDSISFSTLSRQPWILREQGSGSRSYFEHHLAPLLEDPEIILSLDAIDSILSCVQQDLGLTLASKLIMESPFFSDHFAILNTEKQFFRTISLCHHKYKYMAENTKKWVEFLNQSNQSIESS